MLALALCTANSNVVAQPQFDNASFDTMDKLMSDIQARARRVIGNSEDFQITSTGTAPPIGTLLRAGSSITIDREACRPNSPPPADLLTNVFPHFELSRKAATEFGLSAEVAAQGVSLGGKSSDADTINVTIEGAKIQMLSDTEIERLAGRPECARLLRARPSVLVRGHIIGQRTFLLKNVDTTEASGAFAKLFNFKVERGPGTRTTSVKDSSELPILLVLSAIFPGTGQDDRVQAVAPNDRAVMAEAAARLAAAAVARVASATPPASYAGTATPGPVANLIGTPPRVVFGMDQSYPNANRQLGKLGLSNYRIERAGVEPDLLPPGVEIRYFSEADLADAERVLGIVSRGAPEAKLRRMLLSAPPGTIEVWTSTSSR